MSDAMTRLKRDREGYYGSSQFDRDVQTIMAENARLTARIAELETLALRCAELERERDEALMVAEGPSTLQELAAGSVERGFHIHQLEQQIAKYERTHQAVRKTLERILKLPNTGDLGVIRAHVRIALTLYPPGVPQPLSNKETGR